MNVLVTGGAGFVGSALVDRLLAENHHVEVVDDLSTGSLANLAAARHDAAGRLKIHQCDIRDPGFIDVVSRRGPEVVFHLASSTDRTATSLADHVAIDVVGTAQVLHAVEAVSAAKVVVAGSVRASITPSIAALAREAALDLVMQVREHRATECTVIDLPTVYGPRQRPGREGSVVAALAERLAENLPCVIHGTGTQTRDLLHVDDAVDALVKAAIAGDGLRIAVGTGTQTSVNQLHRTMAEMMGSSIAPVSGAPQPDEPGAVTVDPARAGMYLGWEAFTPQEKGLADVLAGSRRF